MIFLPIVERELRVTSRRSATYWGRVVVALVALVVWLWVAVESLATASASRGGVQMFGVLSVVAFGFALLAGAGRTSDSLSGEKREGTLGLLFLTDLKGYDVVIGKLAATSLGAIYGLLAVLPVLAIPILMGGVTAAAFWRVVVVLLNTLFLSLAAGLFASAISRQERKAMGATLLIMMIVTGGLPLMGAWLMAQSAANRVMHLCLLLPSPGFAFYLASEDDPVLFSRATEFWGSILVTLMLSCVLVMLAGRIAPRAWKDKPASLKRLKWRERWRHLILGNADRRAAFRGRLLGINPIYWLSSRERQVASYPWIFLASIGAIWAWCWRISGSSWLEPRVALFLTFGLHAFMKYWVLTVACNSFAADRDNGALELLLSTPLTVADFSRGQWLALRRQFLGPVVVLLVFEAGWMGIGLVVKLPPGEEWTAQWVVVYLLGILMFIFDAATMAWMGMWLSASLKSASRATLVSMARVLILPWLVFGLFSVMLSLFGFFVSPGLPRVVPEPMTYAGLWFVIGLVTDLIYAPWAYWKLRNELRTAATRVVSRSGLEASKAGAPPS